MGKFYRKLINKNQNYDDEQGTLIVSNLSGDCYRVALLRRSDKAILLGDEQGNYAGGLSITPEVYSKYYGADRSDDQNYEPQLIMALEKYKNSDCQELNDFYKNIKKVSYKFHKELFKKIEI